MQISQRHSVSRYSKGRLLKFGNVINCPGENVMEKELAVVDYILNMPPQNMVFLMAILAVSVVGYALHVVREILRSMSKKQED